MAAIETTSTAESAKSAEPNFSACSAGSAVAFRIVVLRVFVAFVVICLAPALAAGQTGLPGAPRAGLTVSVRDAEDRGVPNATVVVRDAGGRSLGDSFLTPEAVAEMEPKLAAISQAVRETE